MSANRATETTEQAKQLITKSIIKTADEERLQKALKRYQAEFEECQAIFEDRNRIYKNTFEVMGLLGTTVTLVGDVYRLRNMIMFEPDHGRKYTEQIEDKLRDVVNQAIISLMMLHEENFEGKQ